MIKNHEIIQKSADLNHCDNDFCFYLLELQHEILEMNFKKYLSDNKM